MDNFDAFGTPNHNNLSDVNMQSGARAAMSSLVLTQTITPLIRKKFPKLKTLLLKLKPGNRQPDLSSLNSEQLDGFVDEMIGDLRDTFTRNINDLRERIKSARPDPSDLNYNVKMELYQDLLSNMVPIIKKIQSLSEEILNELHALINQL